MSLPPNLKVTKQARRIWAYLDQQPEDKRQDVMLKDIQRECEVSKQTAHKWRGLYFEHRGDLQEAPPPSTQRRVEAEDPLAVFPPDPDATRRAPTRPSGGNDPEGEGHAQSGEPPEPSPPPSPPKKRSKLDRKVRDVIL